MPLSYHELCEIVDRGVITDVEHEQINAGSIDVHLGDTIVVEVPPAEDHVPRAVSIARREVFPSRIIDISTKPYLLQPGEFVLGQTREMFNLPSDICAEFKLKSSGARTGLENALATWCFTGSTEVALLDGTSARIDSLVGRDDVWVYALNAAGEFVPARATAVFQSGEATKTVVVTLDNGEQIECTPEHRFMLRDGSYRPAQELAPGTPLMPLARKYTVHGHEEVYSPTFAARGKYVSTHRTVAQLTIGEIPTEHVVHHVDFNERNNCPDNLQIMTAGAHIGVHAKARNATPEARRRHSAHATALCKKLWADPEFAARKRAASSVKAKEMNAKLWADPAHREAMLVTQRKTAREVLSKVPREKVNRAMKLGWLKKTLQLILAAGRAVTPESYTQLKRQNAPTVETLSREFGSFERAVQEAGYSNHTVVSVKTRTHRKPIPVYDMTVPEHHNFALSAGVFVHNCDQGWHGSVLTLELKNFLRWYPLELKAGMFIGQMVFHRTKPVPANRSYAARGRYNNDLTAQTVKE